MKQSFFVGFLATLGVSGSDWQPSYYRSTSSYKTTTYEPISYPSVNVNALFPFSGTSYQSYNYASAQSISNARYQTPITDRSIDSLFLRLPSVQQLDRLILNADSFGILKSIRVVAADDSLTCDQRVAYLLQILGRIRTAVESKQFAADQLKVIIEGAKKQISRLENQINRLQGKIKNLWLSELQSKLEKALSHLEDLYKQFNFVQFQIRPKEAEVDGLKQEVRIIIDASDAERNRINNDQLALTKARAQIRDLQSRLAIARDQRAAVMISIQQSQQIISENQAKIKAARGNINAIEDQIIQLTSTIDGIRGKYSDLEVEVERLRTEISIAETKADQYRADIAALQARIDVERQRIVPDQLNDLNQMIRTLKRMIPTVQGEIDRHYYYCYGEGSVRAQEFSGVVVYIVQGERFGDYLHEQYGTTIRAPNVTRDVRLQNIDIFDSKWIQTHGYPFSQTSLGGDQSFDISGSFNCLNPSKAIKAGGTIHEIGADYFGVTDYNGQKHRLTLSSCSRVQSTSELPTIGQNIAYVAVPSSAQGYNLYQASCW